jgi:multiple sugar transport system substrate-binding protein
VHIAASWIWGAGGDFVSDDGRAALFDQAEARAGLSAFFSLYRHLAPADYNLKDSESLRRFATGQAAITIAGSSAPAVIANVGTQQVLDNLGVAMVPGVPWVGGSNLVIWREAQMLSSRERAVIALVRFLSKPGVQSKYATATNSLPARSDAMRDWPPELAVVNEVCQHTLKVGRTYKPTLIWVRMLNDLSQTFDTLTAEVLADPRREIGEFLDQHLRPLAERFNLMLAR